MSEPSKSRGAQPRVEQTVRVELTPVPPSRTIQLRTLPNGLVQRSEVIRAFGVTGATVRNWAVAHNLRRIKMGSETLLDPAEMFERVPALWKYEVVAAETKNAD